MDAFVKIDGVSFNQSWAKTKTRNEFIAEFMPEDNSHIYPGLTGKDREKALGAVYDQLTAKAKEAAAAGEPKA